MMNGTFYQDIKIYHFPHHITQPICFRLVASVFRILSTEVLGYDVKVVDHASLIKEHEEEYDEDEDDMLDTEEIFNTLSSCNNPL